MLNRYALTASFLLVSAVSLRADFSGDFAVGTPGVYELKQADPFPTFENWVASFNDSGASGGSAVINTSAAPGAVDISVTGYPGGTGNVGFSYASFTTAGLLSFNLTGTLLVHLDGNPISSGDTNYSFAVSPGQTLSFGASATGTDTIIIPDPEGDGPPTIIPPQPVTKSGHISNFNFTPIPEPSAYAFAVGAGVLGLTVCRRRRYARGLGIGRAKERLPARTHLVSRSLRRERSSVFP